MQEFLTFVKVTNSFESLMRATDCPQNTHRCNILCIGANSLRESQNALKPDLGLPCGHCPGCQATYDIYAFSFLPSGPHYEFFEFLLLCNNSPSYSLISTLLTNYFMPGIAFCTEDITVTFLKYNSLLSL